MYRYIVTLHSSVRCSDSGCHVLGLCMCVTITKQLSLPCLCTQIWKIWLLIIVLHKFDIFSWSNEAKSLFWKAPNISSVCLSINLTITATLIYRFALNFESTYLVEWCICNFILFPWKHNEIKFDLKTSFQKVECINIFYFLQMGKYIWRHLF